VTARRIVVVNDRMQQGYRYELVEPAGQHFDPEFRPELRPEEMLALGVFAGKYMTDTRDEFPPAWFGGARLAGPGATPSSTFSGSTPVSHFRCGGGRGGCIPTIRAAGSNGIAAIIWAGAWPRRTIARSGGGRRCAVMSARSSAIAKKAISAAAAASARHCCTGPTTAASCEQVAGTTPGKPGATLPRRFARRGHGRRAVSAAGPGRRAPCRIRWRRHRPAHASPRRGVRHRPPRLCGE
jgi:hypothetical protein